MTSGPTYFHGGEDGLSVGQYVLPAAATGRIKPRNLHPDYEPDRVYMTGRHTMTLVLEPWTRS
jgi:hypothetical protein